MSKIRLLKLKDHWPIFGYLLISVILLFPIFLQNGVPFKYDWAWPLFSMKEYLFGLTDFGNLGLLALFSRYLNLVLGLSGYIGISPPLGIKLFLLAIHFFAAYGFYRFLLNRGVGKFTAFIGGLAYSFSAYIFIRTVVGFTTSLAAYAAMPFFVDRLSRDKFKIIDLIVSVISLAFIFAQSQAGVLVFLFSIIWFILPEKKISYIEKFKRCFLIIAGFIIIHLPWIIIYLSQQKAAIPSGAETTTLNFIASLPHSLVRVLMLSEHHITYRFFDFYSSILLVKIGFAVIYLIALYSLKDRGNRSLTLALFISSLIILPFTLGPTGVFGPIYSFFYQRFPLITLFRETYHFEFLLSFALIALFSFGLNSIAGVLKNKRSRNFFYPASVILVLLFIAQYFTFNYFERFSLQPIPKEYKEFSFYAKDSCKKIYYQPSMGFVRFKNDSTADAANSDLIAKAVGVSYITDASSVLNLSSESMFIRNRLTSHFLESEDSGEIAQILAESGADCLVVRSDMSSNYHLDAKIHLESDQAVKDKWINRSDLLALAKSKKGLDLVKQFGDKVYLFKISKSEFRNSKQYNDSNIETIDPLNERMAKQLPIPSWASEFNYYKDGWIRGRYAFWRKLIFADLMQDFLYTTKEGAVLSQKAGESIDGDLYIRYLDGGSGSFQLQISNSKFLITKQLGDEKFVVTNLGRVEIKAGDKIEIKNISGENAIADLVISE